MMSCQGSTSDVACFDVSVCTVSPSVCLCDIWLGLGS